MGEKRLNARAARNDQSLADGRAAPEGGAAGEGPRPGAAPPEELAEELAAMALPGWEPRARAPAPGPKVLEVTEDNILTYAQGEYSLISVDLRCAFSEPLAARVEACFRDEVMSCFAVRRELINYKKVCLHLWQTGSAVEKDLRQLSSFFYSDVLEGGLSTGRHGEECATEPRRQRYCEIANAMQECKGAMAAIWDARYFGKVICNLPRHPGSGVPWKFEELPRSLEVWKSLEQARQFLRNQTALDAYLASRYNRSWSDRHLVQSPLATEGLRQLMAAVEGACLGLPGPAVRYVELVLTSCASPTIARGAAKAMAIRSALRRYCGALGEVVAGAEEALAEAAALRAGSDPESSALSPGLRLFAQKYARLLSGVLPVVREMLRWLGPSPKTRSGRHGSERRFVSGSRGAAAFVPRGFPDMMQPFLGVASVGWPRSAQPRPGEEVNLKVCDQWQCEECGLLRGDGEDVWELVGRLRPAAVFLDFDRTLATTRAGGSPLEGNHSVDIETFLAAKGVSVQRVRCIKREALRNKADAITEEMAALDPSSVGVFVDDDIRELTDPLLKPLVEAGRLKRLLFVRAGGKDTCYGAKSFDRAECYGAKSFDSPYEREPELIEAAHRHGRGHLHLRASPHPRGESSSGPVGTAEQPSPTEGRKLEGAGSPGALGACAPCLLQQPARRVRHRASARAAWSRRLVAASLAGPARVRLRWNPCTAHRATARGARRRSHDGASDVSGVASGPAAGEPGTVSPLATPPPCRGAPGDRSASVADAGVPGGPSVSSRPSAIRRHSQVHRGPSRASLANAAAEQKAAALARHSPGTTPTAAAPWTDHSELMECLAELGMRPKTEDPTSGRRSTASSSTSAGAAVQLQGVLH
ncbi:unnamed protein product [Prorocentrum cordatum]|uniref:Uncharacterized protein n=1 Tax=Prorocentrum cordatum TaxID=2364126 RepID=A0ABN9WBC6_9DINO|nr:unnamed protein product [Polarella glacialis]